MITLRASWTWSMAPRTNAANSKLIQSTTSMVAPGTPSLRNWDQPRKDSQLHPVQQTMYNHSFRNAALPRTNGYLQFSIQYTKTLLLPHWTHTASLHTSFPNGLLSRSPHLSMSLHEALVPRHSQWWWLVVTSSLAQLMLLHLCKVVEIINNLLLPLLV